MSKFKFNLQQLQKLLLRKITKERKLNNGGLYLAPMFLLNSQIVPTSTYYICKF